MDKTALSLERKAYLKSLQMRKSAVAAFRITLLVGVIALWEILARVGAIDSFIMSSPSRIWETILELWRSGELWRLIWVTVQ